jgi:zinc/manganese transport system ATP-binding protein
MGSGADAMTAPVQLTSASLTVHGRRLWQQLELSISAGEFLAVLGPNGAGKTSLLRVLLGLQQLTAGTVTVNGRQPRRGSDQVGYVPQHSSFDRDLPLSGRDLVRLGRDGHRWGVGGLRARADHRISAVLDEVGATRYADAPIGRLSGGEQQRLRIAQALLTDPVLLLCDEPLLSLDLAHQQAVTGLIDARRRERNTAVLFVTHDVNPVLPYVDRVLYLVGEQWAVGEPAEVLTSEQLSALYGTAVDVLRVRDRIIVIGTGDASLEEPGAHHESWHFHASGHGHS